MTGAAARRRHRTRAREGQPAARRRRAAGRRLPRHRHGFPRGLALRRRDCRAAEDDTIRVTVEGPEASRVPARRGQPCGPGGTVCSPSAPASRPPSICTCTRRIPVAGGMAGGSADAAGALLACDALWGTGLTRRDLLELAAELGSDVPFGLVGGTAIGLGRGERLMPALARGHFDWVFALADGALSTPRVYAECDRLRAGRVLPEPRVSDDLMTALRAGNAAALGRALRNDLQPAACSLRPVAAAGPGGGGRLRRARRDRQRQRARPWPSSSATTSTGSTWRSRSPPAACAGREAGVRPGARCADRRARSRRPERPAAAQPRQPRGRRQGPRHPDPARRCLAGRRRRRAHRRRRAQRRRQDDAARGAGPARARRRRSGHARRRARGWAGCPARRPRPRRDRARGGPR